MAVNHKEQRWEQVQHGQDAAALQSPYVPAGTEVIQVINMQDPSLDYTDLRLAKEHKDVVTGTSAQSVGASGAGASRPGLSEPGQENPAEAPSPRASSGTGHQAKESLSTLRRTADGRQWQAI